jgi:hypothetical protein
MSGNRGTREQLGAYLRENGIPVSDSQLDKLCMPSANQGPTPVFWWGKRPIYDFEEGLKWAEARARRVRRVPASEAEKPAASRLRRL